MENEMFTFVVCNHFAHSTESVYCTRHEANRKFDRLCAATEKQPEGDYVAYYAASVGGLINSYRKA
jgi:hypothetical protein